MAPKINHERLSFFDLSAELRNKIYSYSLVFAEPIVVWAYMVEGRTHFWASSGKYVLIRRDPVTQVLATCRLVNQEASPIFYGQNVFFFGYKALKPFLRAFPSLNSRLRQVKLEHDPRPELVSALKLLKQCTVLSYVELDSQYLCNTSPDKMAKALGPFMRVVHKRKGSSKETTLATLKFAELENSEDHSSEYQNAYKEKVFQVKKMIMESLK